VHDDDDDDDEAAQKLRPRSRPAKRKARERVFRAASRGDVIKDVQIEENAASEHGWTRGRLLSSANRRCDQR